MDKKQYCYILYDYKNVNTVELRWLELEGTVKICSSYRSSSHRGPIFSKRKKSDSDPGHFHYALLTNAEYHGLLS